MKLTSRHFPLIILMGITLFLLFFRLDNSRLAPWDEAWYATLARNIYKSGDIFNLSFNGKPFWDHPPLAFILMSISYAFLGINEFAARFPMALAGTVSVGLIYLTTEKLTGGKRFGLIAGLVLLSSRWFLLRARTANLEALLLLTQLGVFYFSIFAKKHKDLYPLWLVFGLSLLVKSVISVTLLPLVAIATYLVLKNEGRIRLNFLAPLLLVVSPWYLINGLKHGWPFFERNIFEIAFRGKGGFDTGIIELSKTLLYFRSSVHKWYWPSILSSVWGVFRIKDVNFRWLLLYLAITTIPYFASPTTEIWHLLPMLPAVALMIGYATKSVSNLVPKLMRDVFIWSSLVAVGIIAALSIKSYWPSLYYDWHEAFEAQLAISSKQYPYPLYLQDTTYVPTVVFYSEKPVSLIWDDKKLVDKIQRPFQIITREHMLLDAKDFTVVDKAGDTVLATFE